MGVVVVVVGRYKKVGPVVVGRRSSQSCPSHQLARCIWGELSSSRRVGRNQPTSEHNHLEYPWGKLASIVEERLD